jgi:T5orf172 domain
METVSRPLCKCCKCGWEWVALSEEAPKRCANPKCRSPYWQSEACVYVSRATAYENVYKIGCTRNFRQRHGSRPRESFTCIIVLPSNARSAERAIHSHFKHLRCTPNSETFRLGETEITELLTLRDSPTKLETLVSWGYKP